LPSQQISNVVIDRPESARGIERRNVALVAASIARWTESGRSLPAASTIFAKDRCAITSNDLHNEPKILGSLTKSS
jgi:hypothetical protein